MVVVQAEGSGEGVRQPEIVVVVAIDGREEGGGRTEGRVGAPGGNQGRARRLGRLGSDNYNNGLGIQCEGLFRLDQRVEIALVVLPELDSTRTYIGSRPVLLIQWLCLHYRYLRAQRDPSRQNEYS